MDSGLPTDYVDDDPYADLPRRRDRRLEVALVVVAIVVVAGAIWLFTRSPGPPTDPIGVRADATTCEAPCDRIDPVVTLAWTPPEAGADPSGYRVVRDDAPLEASISASELTFRDETVTIGETYAYQVVATSSEGDSPATDPVEVTVPKPPEDAAHLSGVYRVELTVRSARSIGAAFGIDNPLPGKRRTDRWAFSPTCGAQDGACPSMWSQLDGAIEPSGTSWTGTVDGRPARCGDQGRAPAPIDIDFETVDTGAVDGAWVVSGFRGTATVAFQCPGFPAASATVEVTGRL